jgi:hypothetical protein
MLWPDAGTVKGRLSSATVVSCVVPTSAMPKTSTRSYPGINPPVQYCSLSDSSHVPMASMEIPQAGAFILPNTQPQDEGHRDFSYVHLKPAPLRLSQKSQSSSDVTASPNPISEIPQNASPMPRGAIEMAPPARSSRSVLASLISKFETLDAISNVESPGLTRRSGQRRDFSIHSSPTETSPGTNHGVCRAESYHDPFHSPQLRYTPKPASSVTSRQCSPRQINTVSMVRVGSQDTTLSINTSIRRTSLKSPGPPTRSPIETTKNNTVRNEIRNVPSDPKNSLNNTQLRQNGLSTTVAERRRMFEKSSSESQILKPAQRMLPKSKSGYEISKSVNPLGAGPARHHMTKARGEQQSPPSALRSPIQKPKQSPLRTAQPRPIPSVANLRMSFEKDAPLAANEPLAVTVSRSPKRRWQPVTPTKEAKSSPRGPATTKEEAKLLQPEHFRVRKPPRVSLSVSKPFPNNKARLCEIDSREHSLKPKALEPNRTGRDRTITTTNSPGHPSKEARIRHSSPLHPLFRTRRPDAGDRSRVSTPSPRIQKASRDGSPEQRLPTSVPETRVSNLRRQYDGPSASSECSFLTLGEGRGRTFPSMTPKYISDRDFSAKMAPISADDGSSKGRHSDETGSFKKAKQAAIDLSDQKMHEPQVRPLKAKVGLFESLGESASARTVSKRQPGKWVVKQGIGMWRKISASWDSDKSHGHKTRVEGDKSSRVSQRLSAEAVAGSERRVDAARPAASLSMGEGVDRQNEPRRFPSRTKATRSDEPLGKTEKLMAKDRLLRTRKSYAVLRKIGPDGDFNVDGPAGVTNRAKRVGQSSLRQSMTSPADLAQNCRVSDQTRRSSWSRKLSWGRKLGTAPIVAKAQCHLQHPRPQRAAQLSELKKFASLGRDRLNDVGTAWDDVDRYVRYAGGF